MTQPTTLPCPSPRSSLDAHSTVHANCGGTILDASNHRYCDTCFAFVFDATAAFPAGTNRAANVAAYDAGDERSPE